MSKFANRNVGMVGNGGSIQIYGNSPASQDKADIQALSYLTSLQDDPDLKLLCGKTDYTFFHGNSMPIECFYQGKNVSDDSQKNIVPLNDLPPYYRNGYLHLLRGKSQESDGSRVWSIFSLNNKGSGLDALYWTVVHNGNRRGILKEFTVCILDVPSDVRVVSIIAKGCENMRGIDQEIAIKTVFRITCGSKNGTFSDDDAKIQLVRDNYDMKTVIFDKVWTVADMKSSVSV